MPPGQLRGVEHCVHAANHVSAPPWSSEAKNTPVGAPFSTAVYRPGLSSDASVLAALQRDKPEVLVVDDVTGSIGGQRLLSHGVHHVEAYYIDLGGTLGDHDVT